MGFGMVAAAAIAGVSDRALSQQAPAAQQLDTINVEAQRARPSRRRMQQAPQAPQPPSAPVERGDGPVQGYVASQSLTGTKTDTPILETPQSISVVTQDQITDQAAQTLNQALRYTPGVFVEPNGVSSRYDETRVRGFTPVQYLDGLVLPYNQFWATSRIEPYGLERIEVLKGPASVLYGQNSPGGLMNMVSKRPTAEPLREVELQTGSLDRLQGAFDLSGPANQEKTLFYRLTGLMLDSDTAVDFTKDKRLYIAPAFTWRPNIDTTLTVLAHYGEDKGSYPHQYLPAQGTLYFNPNGRIPQSRFAGEPGFDSFDRRQYALGYAFEHHLSDVWTVRQNLRYAAADVYLNALRSEGLLPDLTTLMRSAFNIQADVGTFTVDNQAQADFDTGVFRHKLLVGLDYMKTAGDVDIKFAFPAPSINIFNPVYGQAIPALGPFQKNSTDASQLGLYVQDQIRFGRWLLTLGGRYDWADNEVNNLLANTVAARDDKAHTERAGLSYIFDNGVAPYVSYSTSFQPVTDQVDAAGNPFKPTTGTQYEAGIKYQPPGTKSLFTLAAFDITQQNVVTSDPATFTATQTGEIRVRGFEAEARTSLSESLDLIAGYTYLDSETTQSTNPYEVGRVVPLTPRHQASVWGLHTFRHGPLNGFALGGGVRYVGETYSETQSPDPVLVPSYTLVDAVAQYDLGVLDPSLKGARLAVNVKNIFDKYHVTFCYGLAYCSLGAGRTVLATLSYRW